MSSSGPANLFPPIQPMKAAINLTAGSDGLVLVEQTADDHDTLQARVRLANAKPTFALDAANPPLIADGQAADQFGLRRAPLTVSSTTVAGTYNLVFKVDTLELPITIVIKNPEPKLFVLSGTEGSTPAIRTSMPTNENIKFSTSSTAAEFIKFFDNGGGLNNASAFNTVQAADAKDLFASSTTGVFTVDLKSNYAANNSGFYGRIVIADLAKGAYDFKVVKSYPDGRTETVQDRAEVTGHDNNGLAVFGTPTVLNVNNTMFLNNFLINELAYVKGTYVFDFTIGTINKKYTINVVDLPSLAVTTVKVGTKTTDLFSGDYILEPQTIGGTILMDFTKKNLTDAQYVSVDAASLIPEFTPVTETKISLKDLTQLELGTLTSAARSDGNKIYFTLKFWNKVPYSTSASLYTRTGEDQVVVVGFNEEFKTATTPTMTVHAVPSSITATSAVINYTTAGPTNVGIKYINQLSSLAAPTRNAVANGTDVATSAVGVKSLTINSGISALNQYTIYMLAYDTNGNLANNVVSVSYTTIAVPVPTVLPTGGSFTDSDTDAAQIAGTIAWTAASPTTGITGYKIYWGSSTTVKLVGNTAVVYTVADPTTTSQTVTANTALPVGATHFLIYSYNAGGDSAAALAIAITDAAVPTVLPTNGSFTDSDSDATQIEGTIAWTAANPTTGITGYKIYWGSDATTILSTDTTVEYTVSSAATESQAVAENTALPANATHFLIYSYNADGDSALALAIPITDVGA
jgi:hypothetical protein